VRNTLERAGACWKKTSHDFKEEFLKLSGIHLEDMESTGSVFRGLQMENMTID
jgi:hypothetical protein